MCASNKPNPSEIVWRKPVESDKTRDKVLARLVDQEIPVFVTYRQDFGCYSLTDHPHILVLVQAMAEDVVAVQGQNVPIQQ